MTTIAGVMLGLKRYDRTVVDGIWQTLGLSDLLWLLGLSAVILAAVMAYTIGAARVAGLRREDSVVLLFCGSKKSLASGVPMAGAPRPRWG